ncbi:MAG: hypothetical protein AB7H71_17345, partial [Alphaproteobacteria bacterium]
HQAQDGRDPTPAASPRVATRGDAFLSEQGDNTNFRYYKDGLTAAQAGGSPRCVSHRPQTTPRLRWLGAVAHKP